MIAGHNLKLKQSTFFCCVEKNNSNSFYMIFKNRKVDDINSYNDEVQRSILNMHGIFFLFCYVEILNCRVASLHSEFRSSLEIGSPILRKEPRFLLCSIICNQECFTFCKMMEILLHAIGFAHAAFAICVKYLSRDEV